MAISCCPWARKTLASSSCKDQRIYSLQNFYWRRATCNMGMEKVCAAQEIKIHLQILTTFGNWRKWNLQKMKLKDNYTAAEEIGGYKKYESTWRHNDIDSKDYPTHLTFFSTFHTKKIEEVHFESPIDIN